MLELRGLGDAGGINRRKTSEMDKLMNSLGAVKLNPNLQFELCVSTIPSQALQERYSTRQHLDQTWFRIDDQTGKYEQYVVKGDPPLEVNDNELLIYFRVWGDKDIMDKCYEIAHKHLHLTSQFSYQPVKSTKEHQANGILYIYPVDIDKMQLFLPIPNENIIQSIPHIINLIGL